MCHGHYKVVKPGYKSCHLNTTYATQRIMNELFAEENRKYTEKFIRINPWKN